MPVQSTITPALLRLSEVQCLVGLKKTAIYSRVGAGVFPEPLKLGERCVRWRTEDIEAWLADPTRLPNQSRDEGVSA